MRTVLKNSIRVLQALSLDVVAGALAMGLFALKWCNVSLPRVWWLILAMAVWIIYTADHLIDSLKKKERAVIFRHRMHYRFRIPIAVFIVVLALITLTLSIIYLNQRIILAGALLSFTVLTYLLFIALFHLQEKYFLKEIFIAVIYVLGIWLAPLVSGSGYPTGFTFVLLAGFILLVFSEGVLVSRYEMELDKHDAHPSFARYFGDKTTDQIVKYILITVFITTIIMAFFTKSMYRTGFIIEAVMTIFLFLMLKIKKPLIKSDRYHLLGEMIFWLPALLHYF